MACAAATAGCLLKLAALFAWGAAYRFRLESWYVPSILGQLIEPAAVLAVAGTWLAVLALAGLWARERTWVDDLGIAVATPGSPWRRYRLGRPLPGLIPIGMETGTPRA